MMYIKLKPLEPTTEPDNLEHVAALKRTNVNLKAEKQALRDRMKKNNKEHNEREKELLHAITIANRRIKKLEQRVISRDDTIRDLKNKYKEIK